MGYYKRKVEARVAKLGVKPIGARDVQYLRLPVEIFGVIAGLLTGCHAFGSVANLNVTSRAIHHETLPVLYETMLLDNVWNLPYYDGGGKIKKPNGFRYTRYHFCVYTDDLTIPGLMSMFLNLAATVMLSTSAEYHREFHLFVHRTISTATVFDPMEMLGFRSGPSAKPDMNSCAADLSRPQIRPAESIQYLHLAHGAYLINTDKATDSPPRWATGTMLENMRFIRPSFIKSDDEKGIDTALELLKLAAR